MSSANSARASRNSNSQEQTPPAADARAKKPEYIPCSVTTAKGFVNSITEVDRASDDEKTLYFARLAIVTGREKHGNDYRDRLQFVDVLIGNKLRKLVANVVANARLDDKSATRATNETPGYIFDGVLCHFVLNDLHFDVYMDDQVNGSSKGYLNSRGVLAELTFG